jgi:cytochrome c oxidase subunit 3
MTDVVPFRQPPPPPRETTSFLGMVIFLGAWAMTFAALFFAYADIRLSANMWPPEGEIAAPRLLVWEAALNTLVLLGSSVLLGLGLSSVSARPRAFVRYLTGTILLGVVFLGLQLLVWSQLVKAGLRWDTGRYGSVFYTLTFFHALHVLVGIFGLLLLMPGALRGKYTVQRHVPVRNWTLFWHFVDGIWVLMFVTVYLI